MHEASITIGIDSTVGKVIVNPEDIRGMGDWHNPYLHIPLKIQFYPRPKGEYIALIRLTASLHLAETHDITNQFGVQISYDFINNLSNRSYGGTAPSEGGTRLLFSLTHEQIKQLEDLRHQHNSKLYLYLDPIVARVQFIEDAYLMQGEYKQGVQQADLSYLWQAAIGTLSIDTAEMKWAENIFPGIGYDRFRLIEITLPSPSKLVPDNAVEMFEKARRDYDTANYNNCVEKCRFVIEAIERHLSVPAHTHKLGDAVAIALGWIADTDQCKFLNLACQAYFKLTSAAHHYPSTISLLPADAQIALHSTATLLEYLGQLR